MGVDIHRSYSHHESPQHHPYSSTPASSVSSSASSEFSVDAASSQSSDSNYTSASISVSWDDEDVCHATTAQQILAPPTIVQVDTVQSSVPVELRQHPRRCPPAVASRPPPTLVRQSERKGQFVDSLVDSATQMVEVIWPLSAPSCVATERYLNHSVLPLRTFIQETLRRSRTSFSTLQVALYYLILIKAHVPRYDFTMEQPVDSTWSRTLQCGRRMFLAALILASKYLQDRNYSARAWSKISGLKVCEINTNEMAFLEAVNWKLHLPEPLFDRWQAILLKYTAQSPTSPIYPAFYQQVSWRTVVPILTPELDTVDLAAHHTIASSPYTKAMSVAYPHHPPPTPTTSTTASISISSATPTQQQMMPMTPISPIVPRTMEPASQPQPPTPSFVRMGPLPTPSLTPQSVISNTPAASYAGYESSSSVTPVSSGIYRGGNAMSQVQSAIRRDTFNNCSMDMWTRPNPVRRPSAVSSSSSASSPESMVSDSSSRCSRASSISSASSSIVISSSAAVNGAASGGAGSMSAPMNQLCRMATLRSAGLKGMTSYSHHHHQHQQQQQQQQQQYQFSQQSQDYHQQQYMQAQQYQQQLTRQYMLQSGADHHPTAANRYINCDNGLALGTITMEPLTAEPISSPELENFHIADAEIESPSTRHIAYRVKDTETAPKRKRGRSSIDLTLQQNVRNLLQAGNLLAEVGSRMEVLPDRSVASSFLLNTTSGNANPLSTSYSSSSSPYTSYTSVDGSKSNHKALQSPARSVPSGRRMVVQRGDLGRKRACCFTS